MKVAVRIAGAVLPALLASSTLLPAQARMLQGSVAETQRSTVQTAAVQSSVSNNADIVKQARAQALEGVWTCTTKVVESSARGVVPGTLIQCQIAYNRDVQGNVIQTWLQSGWAPAASAVVKLDNNKISVSHASSYAGRDAQSQSARSSDVMKLVSPNTMVAQSLVTQYVNGQYVGQYRTASVLHKAS